MRQLTILVPYQNRKSYLDVFLSEVPKYLERVNGITDYSIYVAEQQSPDRFNLALSRNVAALAALSDGVAGYLVFHDVDIIPVDHIDYGPCGFNVSWFLSAGSCKIEAADFVKANGYNPDFVGWGDEDVEFYHRLIYMGSDLRQWHRLPESQEAVAINLEWPEMSDDKSLVWSKSYFGYKTTGPRFVSYRGAASDREFERYNKFADFLDAGQQARNHELCNWMRAFSAAEKSSYIARNGLNRVRLNRAVRRTCGRIRWISYQTEDVLVPSAL
jgi:N-terminal region of glycosyl transferase group 7/N-terminal domain of galactosyltransferase